MSIDEANRIHFIGIGGIGMSALARLFLHAGKVVTGSDATNIATTSRLEALGIDINFEQTADNITDGIDFVVYTEAMPQNHPELVAARDQGIETVNYFQALGMVANQYYLIAVAGTHGKSTTTAMLTDILEEASFDPTAVIGTLRSKTGSNFRPGKSKYFIAEACEYKEDFKYLKPDVLVITNIENEHVDYYHDLAAVQQAFKRLVDSVPPDGAIITQASDENIVLRNFAIKARELGIITLASDQRTFKWGSNGRKLMAVPFDENPYSAMAAWFKTDEGLEVYKSIDKRLS